MTALVTGGAGYIGSHVARLLRQQGVAVVFADDLSTGVPTRAEGFEKIILDMAASDSSTKLSKILREHNVTSVIHLAARKKVGESVERPEWYYQQNVGGLANLLVAMKKAEVKKLVFSSSAATYGMPNVAAVSEDYDCQPINPYGETKLIGEWMVSNAQRAWGLSAINLRYFNVAGTGWDDLADTSTANLVPIVVSAIKANKRPVVFGDDYDTADGTCIRDYVHVLDLAEAHISAMNYLTDHPGIVRTFNVGTGRGSSVFEVLEAIKQVSGIQFEFEVQARREGDPASLTANVQRIQDELGWRAKFGLEEIVRSAWNSAANS